MKKVKKETSKIILYIILGLNLIVSFVTIFLCFLNSTVEPLCYLIPSTFTELAAATGGYYWKAKNENKIKMILSAVKEVSKQDDLTEEQTRITEALINNLN